MNRLKSSIIPFKEFLSHVAIANADTNAEQRMLMRLQGVLFVSDSKLRSMKRLAGDWENLKTREKRTLVSSLLTYFRTNASKSELLSYIQKLARERDYVEKGAQVKPSKAMAIGAALAGAYLGYKWGRGGSPDYSKKKLKLK
jgi:hypothetical protein